MNSIINKTFKDMKGGFYIEAYSHEDLYLLEKDYKWTGFCIEKDLGVFNRIKNNREHSVFFNIDNSAEPNFRSFYDLIVEYNNSTMIHHLSFKKLNPLFVLTHFFEQLILMDNQDPKSWKKKILTLALEYKYCSQDLINLLDKNCITKAYKEGDTQFFIHKSLEILL